MAKSPYIRDVLSEQQLIEDLYVESVNHMGRDVYYLPRNLVDENKYLTGIITKLYTADNAIARTTIFNEYSNGKILLYIYIDPKNARNHHYEIHKTHLNYNDLCIFWNQSRHIIVQ